jgi:hypothetical protein
MSNLNDAAAFIFWNGILHNFGTGALAKPTDVCLKQEIFIKKKFGLSDSEFSQAFAMAEKIDQTEAESEAAFFKSHPELNP